MSLKENIDMVKDELNSEEKMFENAIKAEKYYKKYKKPFFGLIAATIIGIGGNAIYNNSVENKIKKSNQLFLKVQKNPLDKSAADELKRVDPKLYLAWEFSEAMKDKNIDKLNEIAQSKATVINSIAAYEVASQSKDLAKLEQYTMRQDAIYKDLALLESAYLLMKENKIDDAHQKLQMISSDSSLYKISQVLMHYGVK